MSIAFDEILKETERHLHFMMDDSVCLSYPLPDVEHGRRLDRMFLYRRGSRSLEAARPFALITLDHDTGAMLAYADARLSDFMGGGRPWNEKISYALSGTVSVKDMKAEQAMIRKLYEGVRQFAFQDRLTEPEKQVLQKFVFLMEHGVPAGLTPYYQAMGKNFYRWVNEHV